MIHVKSWKYTISRSVTVMAVLLRSSKIDNGAVKYSVTLAQQRYSQPFVFAIVPKFRAKAQKEEGIHQYNGYAARSSPIGAIDFVQPWRRACRSRHSIYGG